MCPQASHAHAGPPIRNGVLVLAGRQVAVSVRNGQLHVSDSLGREERSASYARATCPIKRVVITGTGGYLSLDATEWLADLKIPLVHLHPSGRVLLASGHRGLDDARLRRQQALAAPDTPLGLELARDLLTRKLDGQAALLSRLPGGAAVESAFAVERVALDTAASVDALRLAEARAAAAYWQAWAGLPVRFITRDAHAVPPHWLTFTARSSPITGTPRLAGDLANATLNYCYALAENEARLGLLGVGLDPALGVLHLDTPNRDSLAADLQEAIRPEVDAYVLDLIESRVFTRRDVHETRRGQVRMLPTLSHELAATVTIWAERIAPVAEHVAGRIATQAGIQPSTPLTGSRRRRAHPRTGRLPASPNPPPLPPNRCLDCGIEVPDGHRRCSACHAAANHARLTTYRHNQTARRARGETVLQQTTEVRAGIGQSQRAQWDARRQAVPAGGWTGTPSEFRRLIQPKLAGTKPSDLAQATGLSPGYCAQVRDGRRTPHVRHWAAFQLMGLRSQGSDC